MVFDFDNTSVIFDIQEALLIYQIENLQFKIDPPTWRPFWRPAFPT